MRTSDIVICRVEKCMCVDCYSVIFISSILFTQSIFLNLISYILYIFGWHTSDSYFIAIELLTTVTRSRRLEACISIRER